MHTRIARILIFFVLIGIAHGAYVQLTYSRYHKNAVAELMGQSNLLYLEDYLYSSTHAPLLLAGTSVSGCIDTDVFRVPGDKMPIVGGNTVGLDLLLAQPTLPAIILIETNNIFVYGGADQSAQEASTILKRHLQQCRTCFRPTVMFLTELSHWMNTEQLYSRGEAKPQKPTVAPSYKNVLKEQEIQRSIALFQKVPPAEDLNKAVAHTKLCIDQCIKRGSRVILLEIPMDPRLAATPHYTHIRASMRAAFPANTYQWITLNPDLLEYSDGLHIAPQCAQKAGKLIDQAIASLGLYQQLGLVPTPGDAGDK